MESISNNINANAVNASHTDTSTWANDVYGDIDNLRKEITQLSKGIKDLPTEKQKSELKFIELEQRVTKLEQRVTELESQKPTDIVSTLEQKINTLESENYNLSAQIDYINRQSDVSFINRSMTSRSMTIANPLYLMLKPLAVNDGTLSQIFLEKYMPQLLEQSKTDKETAESLCKTVYTFVTFAKKRNNEEVRESAANFAKKIAETLPINSKNAIDLDNTSFEKDCRKYVFKSFVFLSKLVKSLDSEKTKKDLASTQKMNQAQENGLVAPQNTPSTWNWLKSSIFTKSELQMSQK